MKHVITISRQFGSGGRVIGYYIAEKLKIPFYDNKLISLAAQENNVSPEVYAAYDEKASKLFGNMVYANPSMGYFSPYIGEMAINDKLFKTQSDIILEKAKEPCVIVGRCSDFVLKKQPNVVNVFLYADLQSRKKRVEEKYEQKFKNTEKQILRIDKQRAHYYSTYTEQEWGNPINYDICINTSKLGIEKVGDFIIEYVNVLESK